MRIKIYFLTFYHLWFVSRRHVCMCGLIMVLTGWIMVDVLHFVISLLSAPFVLNFSFCSFRSVATLVVVSRGL